MVQPESWRSSLVAVCVGATLVGGCSRQFYRRRADRDAEKLIAEKNYHPRWQSEDLGVYPSSLSRFYEPYSQDKPPMPPDDPHSHQFMERVYNIKGPHRWQHVPRIGDVQNPDWLKLLPAYVETSSEGKMKLSLETAALLGRLHSTDYQQNLEEIYLAALDVAIERFQFDVQLMGGNTTSIRARGNEPAAVLGALRRGGRTPATTIIDTTSTLDASKFFAAGGQLLAGIANSIVFQVAGSNSTFHTSILDFSVVQPLLRGGTKVVNLERLTRVERSLLAALRSQAQFRQEFYKNLAIGGGVQTRPRRIGGFQGGAGLSGFTGTGQGGFGGVGAGQNFAGFGGRNVGASGAGGGAGLAGGGEGNVGGYTGLVQQLQAIRNTRASLAAQELNLGLLESLFEGGLIDLVQVDQFRQNIETEKATLLRSQVAFQDQLEFYLINTLNLPPTIPVELDDSLVRPFQLIDTNVSEAQNRAARLFEKMGVLPETPSVEQLKEVIAPIKEILDSTTSLFENARKDFAALKEKKEERLKAAITDKEKATFEKELENLEKSLTDAGTRFKALRARPEEISKKLATGTENQALAQTVELLRTLSGQLQELGLLQARARLEQIVVKPVELTFEQAFLVARENRLDWMNNRANLTDQWRLIAFNANRLRAMVNVQMDGDLGTLGNNPVKFRGPTGSLRARLVFDAPLNRKAERNLYRESLIDYQRAKRSYVGFIDQVALTLRSRLRGLERLRTNLEIQRRALLISIRRVDQTLEELNEPFAPPQPGQPPAQLGPVLAQNLLQALSDLRNTQDNFMSVWLGYEQARMNLMFELGLMRLDERGIWVDESLESALARCFQGDQGELMFCEEVGYLGLDKGVAKDATALLDDDEKQEWSATVAQSLKSRALNHDAALEGTHPKDQSQLGTTVAKSSGLKLKLEANTQKDGAEVAPLSLSPMATPAKLNKASPRPTRKPAGLLEILWPRDEDSYESDAPPLARDTFLQNLRRVAEQSERGLAPDAIAKETGLHLTEVLAYRRAVERSRDSGAAVTATPTEVARLPETLVPVQASKSRSFVTRPARVPVLVPAPEPVDMPRNTPQVPQIRTATKPERKPGPR